MSQTTLPGTDIDLTDDDVSAIDELGNVYRRLCKELGRVIVGQTDVIEQLAICLFARGHGLLMGVPGLAKTLLVSKLAETMSLKFSRIQFTPDLMPMDITGTDILQDDMDGRRAFQFIYGPVFANIVLADEINRASPKTQAALLEAMEERQVTVDTTTHRLPSPFMVIATQNPVEHEGTYPLPESQLDRFLLRIRMGRLLRCRVRRGRLLFHRGTRPPGRSLRRRQRILCKMEQKRRWMCDLPGLWREFDSGGGQQH